MAWTAKISYLDGVSFAINPLFVPSEQDENEIEELFYDLDKANSILNCKPDFLIENKILMNEEDDEDNVDVDDTDMHRSNSTGLNDLKRSKFSSFTQSTEKDQESILKLLNEFKSPLAFQASLSNSLAGQPNHEVKFNLGHSPTPSNLLARSLPPVTQLPTSSVYPNPQIANINFNVHTLKNNRSTENFENMSKSPRIENETVKSNVTVPMVPLVSAIQKIPSSFNSILEPIRPLVSATKTNNHDGFLSNGRSGKQDSARNRLPEEKNGDSLDIFSESASADPFNDMELKSINDIEELKNILCQHQMHQNRLLENSSNDSVKDFMKNEPNKRNEDLIKGNLMDGVSLDSELKTNRTIPVAPSFSATDSAQPLNVNSTTTTVASLPCAFNNYGLPNIKFNDLDF